MSRRSTAVPSAAVFSVVGLLAYATEVTKQWILNPVGDWFGDLVPDSKVIVIAALVVVVIGIITGSRIRRRNAVGRANVAIRQTLEARP